MSFSAYAPEESKKKKNSNKNESALSLNLRRTKLAPPFFNGLDGDSGMNEH